MDKLKRCARCHFEAPAILLICYDKTTVWKNLTHGTVGGDVNAGIVITHMMLQAAESGLGITWVGAFDRQKTRELFGLPEYLAPAALLPVGYPEDTEPHPWHSKRCPIEHTVFYNSFEGIAEGEVH